MTYSFSYPKTALKGSKKGQSENGWLRPRNLYIDIAFWFLTIDVIISLFLDRLFTFTKFQGGGALEFGKSKQPIQKQWNNNNDMYVSNMSGALELF